MPRKPRYQQVEYYSLSPETKKGIFIIFLFLVAIISILSFLDVAGKAGVYIDWALGIAFGWGRYLLPLVLLGLGYVLARPSRYQTSIPTYIGIILFFVSFHGLLHLKVPFQNSFSLSFSGLGGGLVGYLASYFFQLYLGFWAALVVLVGLLFVGILLAFNTSIETFISKTNIFRYLPSPFQHQGITDAEAEEETEESPAPEETADTRANEVKFASKNIIERELKDAGITIRSPKVKIDLPINLLDDRKSKPTSGDIKLGMEKIQKTLENFHIDVEMGEVQVGPTVTQYTLKPAEGIKLSRITALNNDLALAMAAHPIRIEAPIPGKSLVGIEVPNQKPAIVRVREVLESPAFKARKTNLTIALGKDVSGKCWVDKLDDMPHLLVAGATGSGKSVCLNAIIISLLYQNNPDMLRLIMIDPKRVEFPVYNGIPHLLTPVITDVTKTVYALRWAITEMDKRFDILSKAKKRNVTSYNLTAKEKIPYLVIIIDELADLMVAAAAEVEACIIRLTQMARAVGIHLVVATQRPSVDVITGLIKANIPCRIAFSVASLVDSRTILDISGAEKLVGKGDMLFMSPETAKPRRLQGAFVSDDEIKRVVDFSRKASDYQTEYQEEILNKPSGVTSFDFQGGGDDELFEEARNVVVRSGKASASLLQRRLRVGYARAARLIDLLEDAGIVGPAEGAKPRDILIDRVEALTMENQEEVGTSDEEEETSNAQRVTREGESDEELDEEIDDVQADEEQEEQEKEDVQIEEQAVEEETEKIEKKSKKSEDISDDDGGIY
ncbi:DNA translocase FtsK [Candidatus Falkowbacteria bacterium]|nr:DNA translocase FtsK [Candidatus Falkowbacteria bacterium]